MIDDTEAFRRPLGGYFRDRFAAMPAQAGAPARAVRFALPDLPARARRRRLHVPDAAGAGAPVRAAPGRAAGLPRTSGPPTRTCEAFAPRPSSWCRPMRGRPSAASILPHAVREFAIHDLDWLIHRQIQTREIDVLQLEYTPLGQYAGDFQRLACALFEHDVYFQSIARGWTLSAGPGRKAEGALEYLRALRYEMRMLPRFDQIQVCTRENREYLLSFLPGLAGRLQAGLRAGIDTSRYAFAPGGREPFTMLFLGSFRHLPNRRRWTGSPREVLPAVLRAAAGGAAGGGGLRSRRPPHAFHSLDHSNCAASWRTSASRSARYAVFVCPILSGSGVRVKLLEAFAAGIPVVSTRLGAEGLAEPGRRVLRARRRPGGFAAKILSLFEDPEAPRPWPPAPERKWRQNWDMGGSRARLEASYREAVLGEAGDYFFGPQIGLLQPVHDAARGAVQFVGGRVARLLVGGPKYLPRARRPPGRRCPCRFRRTMTRRSGYLVRLASRSGLRFSRREAASSDAPRTPLPTCSVKTASACLRIRHHLEQARGGEPVGQVLVQAAGHRQQVDGLHRGEVRGEQASASAERNDA